MRGFFLEEKILYTVKKANDFPILSRDVTNQTLPGWEKLKLFPVREGLVSGIPAGWGRENHKAFLQCNKYHPTRR
jgi:hypothetical protein